MVCFITIKLHLGVDPTSHLDQVYFVCLVFSYHKRVAVDRDSIRPLNAFALPHHRPHLLPIILVQSVNFVCVWKRYVSVLSLSDVTQHGMLEKLWYQTRSRFSSKQMT